MPNHLHLLLLTSHPHELRRTLAIELRAFTRSRYPGRALWESAPVAKLIPDLKHLKREIRYVHLNPCRAGLVKDPLEWEWSTHRDALSLTPEPWVDLALLKKIWGTHGFERQFHAYVSGDPSVHVQGTSLPSGFSGPITASLAQLVLAAHVAGRAPFGAHQLRTPTRRLVVELYASLGGGPDRATLASALKVSKRAVDAILADLPARSQRVELEIARRILGDPRFLKVRDAEPLKS